MKHLSKAMLLMILLGSIHCQVTAPNMPGFVELKPKAELPDPLIMQDGTAVTTPDAWVNERRPEILRLFAHYMYGEMPPPPDNFQATLEREDQQYFGGKATKKEVLLRFGPEGTPPIHLLLVIPNERTGPTPVFLGPNFYANHAVLDDPDLSLSTVWLPNRAEGVENNRATEAARGTAAHRWEMEQSIDRGYAVATIYHGDADPDHDDFTDGVHPHYGKLDQEGRDPNAWGSLSAWAWGLHRAVDYLVTDADIDAERIAVMGHSRNGKAALWAGATDERISLVVSNQSGCGGAALSRRGVGETVKAINESFPHWFAVAFRDFNDQEDYLPIDQHLLIAAIAPRPVLVASAIEDKWADPEGEFQSLIEAQSVYELLGKEGVAVEEMPPVNQLVNSTLGYHIRPGKHGVAAADWAMFMDFADTQFGQ
jgi:hypothetical protein